MTRRHARHPGFEPLARLPDQAPALPPSPPVKPAEAKKAGDALEQALWRAATAGVRPLPASDRAEIERPRPRPQPRQRQNDELAALADSLCGPPFCAEQFDLGREDAFLRPGLPRRLLADLRKGRWVIQAELDLHGLYRDEARIALAYFLADCLRRGQRCVRIIHGKGLSSPGGEPVLKALSRHWLAGRAEILAFCEARPHDGGAGALLVLLKAPPYPR